MLYAVFTTKLLTDSLVVIFDAERSAVPLPGSELVSAVIPTRNRPELVVKAVQSALRQTHPRIEVIVVIDGPDPPTERALAQIHDPRLRIYLLAANVGGAEARNIGVRAARGEWVGFLDDDDEWLPQKISLQLAAAYANEAAFPVISSRLIVRTPRMDFSPAVHTCQSDQQVSEHLFCRRLDDGPCAMQTSTLFVQRSLMVVVPFRRGLKRHQDWDWLLRASIHPGVRFQVISEPLTIFRIEDGRPSVSRALDWEFSLQWARGSLFVCVSEHIHQTALERGFPADKLWVHRIGIDLHTSELARSPGPQPIILFVGRMVEKKGCAHLIRAMALVNAKLPGARLVAVGDGPLRSELESQAREQSLSAVFLGSQPSSVVRTCMRRAHLLAAPSVIAKNGDTEGLPIVLCEAQAMGLSITGFRGPGVDEAVLDGQTAMLVQPGDHEALAATILRLLADASLRAQLCVAGRQHAAKYFDLRTQTALLEDKYDEVLREQ